MHGPWQNLLFEGPRLQGVPRKRKNKLCNRPRPARDAAQELAPGLLARDPDARSGRQGPAYYQFIAEMHLNAETSLLLHSAQAIFKIANDAFVHGVNLRVL